MSVGHAGAAVGVAVAIGVEEVTGMRPIAVQLYETLKVMLSQPEVPCSLSLKIL